MCVRVLRGRLLLLPDAGHKETRTNAIKDLGFGMGCVAGEGGEIFLETWLWVVMSLRDG